MISHHAVSREWESATGKKVDAELVKVEGNNVTLKRNSDGKEFVLGKLFFSKQDQAFIEKYVAENEVKQDVEELASVEEDGEYQEEKNSNFGEPWPKLISLERDFKVEVVDTETGKFVYHSKNFEFVSDVRLSKSAQRLFGELFESTLLYCQQLPISSMKAINQKPENKKNIYLYSDTEEYYKAGAPEGSAGVYIPSKDVILVGMKFLGLKEMGAGVTLDRAKGNKTLPHEVVHMFTDFTYFKPGALGWFTEGLSEYVAVTPYRSGKYILSSIRRDLVKYVTAFADDGRGRNIGEEFTMPAIEDYMIQPYREFSNFSSGIGNKNYGIAALMVYYFFHLEENGTENITNFLKALKAGKSGEQALEVLCNGRTYRELEADIKKAWRSRDVKITFAAPRSAE